MADARCPNGHVSDWSDYCSQCGAAMTVASPAASDSDPAGAGLAPPAVTNAGTCPSCHSPTLPTDVFCEACGTDLASGVTLAPPVAGPSGASTAPAVEVWADRTYFDAHVDAGALAFPDPAPAAVLLPVTKDELLVGRRSDSRGVFPDIDAQRLTADPAVSHVHALLRRDAAGGWSVTDQGSTNGTRLDAASDLLVPGRAYAVGPGSVVHVGAWTAIRIAGT